MVSVVSMVFSEWTAQGGSGGVALLAEVGGAQGQEAWPPGRGRWGSGGVAFLAEEDQRVRF